MFAALTTVLVALVGVAAPATAQRLPHSATPSHYDLAFVVDLSNARFDGTETIRVQVDAPTTRIVLHAAELEFAAVSIETRTATQTATVTLDAATSTAALVVAKPLPKGPASIHIRYAGTLNGQQRGFYLGTGPTRRYAITQFEATDARRAFPCFDEPAFKATFDVTLTVDRGDVAISNGRVIADTPGPGAAQHTVRFSTTPKMSSYLVAMAVGDFECLSATAVGIPIRVCALPGKKDFGRIALGWAQDILTFYNGYYTIKYPYGKLDVLAVPDFSSGGMENTAAIFFPETEILADDRTASAATRKNIASGLAHEIAHQWFGDLVTMRWWDDIWLNEGFATWMANRPLAALRPDWNVDVDEAEENQAALATDTLQSTRPVRADVNTPEEIDAAFDVISYEKGAAILRMIERYVGAATFRDGINAYLKAHAYGTATSADFSKALQTASGKPIDDIMRTFLDQPGAPLVEVSTAGAGNQPRITLRQERFFAAARPTGAALPERWQMPICLKPLATAPATGAPAPSCVVLQQAAQTLDRDAHVFANAGGTGYYRTAYSPDALRAMASRVATALTAPERLTLLDDTWALMRARRNTAADYLTLAFAYTSESSSVVLSELARHFAFVDEYLTTGASHDRFATFTRATMRPLFGTLGLTVSATDTDQRRELRAALVQMLGTAGDDSDVATAARQMLDRTLAGGPPLDPTLAGAIVRVAARHGDAALYDALTAASERPTTSPDEASLYFNAASRFENPAVIDRALQVALQQTHSQDTSLYLAGFFSNPVARPLAWSFVKANWSALEAKLSVFEGHTAIVRALSSFCDAASRDDIRAFFATHPVTDVGSALDQTVERINSCIDLKATQTPVVSAWLAAQ